MKENSKRSMRSSTLRRRFYWLACTALILFVCCLGGPLRRRAAVWRVQRSTLHTRNPANSAPLRDFFLLSKKYMPQSDVQAAAINSLSRLHSKRVPGMYIQEEKKKKKNLLCVTFVTSDEETLQRVRIGLIAPTTRPGLSVRCDSWLLASYGGPDDVLEAFAEMERSREGAARVEVIRNAGGTIRTAILKELIAELKPIIDGDTLLSEKYNDLILPKTLLLCEVMKRVRGYERVWLMDNDLSLAAFDMDRFFRTVGRIGRAFGSDGSADMGRSPLLMQPLIEGSTQTYAYLNQDSWRGKSSSNVTDLLAVSTDFIEMQFPLIDAAFFEWFITQVVRPVSLAAHILGADWGLDSLFCSSAKMYAQHSAGPLAAEADGSSSYAPCAIILDSDAAKHLDLKTMDGAIGYGAKYALNRHFMRLIEVAFPQFYLFGNDIRAANPLDSSSRVKRYDKLLIED